MKKKKWEKKKAICHLRSKKKKESKGSMRSILVRCTVRGSSAVCRRGYSTCGVVTDARQARLCLQPVFGTVCFPVRPNVSAKLLCCSLLLCYGRLVPGSGWGGGGVPEVIATVTALRDFHPHHQCVVSSPEAALQMECAVSPLLCGGMCLSAWRPSLSVPQSDAVELVAHQMEMDSRVRWWRLE